MAKVYQLYSDEFRDASVSEESRDFFTTESRMNSNGIWDFRKGESKRECWQPISLYSREPLLPIPDIYRFNVSTLLLEERARNVLSDLIAHCGEVYEQPFEDRMCYVLNVMKFADAPIGDDDSPKEGLYYPLEGVDSSLVRMPWGTIMAVSGITPPELDFKHLVDENNLKGLLFREVWDSENYVTPPEME